jgi:hypothetical protein
MLAALALFTACDDDVDVTPEPFSRQESEWFRLALMHEDKIDLMQARTGTIMRTVPGDLVEGARYYTSNSGQYITQINRAGNEVRFFDSGIINHVDHGHDETARWLNQVVTAPVPTHYASSEGHIVIFNDGDGSITHVNELQLGIPGYQPQVHNSFATTAHHGAGFRLGNGLFATTFQDLTVEGANPALPQMVKFVSADGQLINDNGGVVVMNIHGDAVNGEYGVFGSTDGIIVVDEAQNIDLIENIEGLNSASGNWIGTVKGHDNSNIFFGRARSLGEYLIDPVAKTMTQIYSGGDVKGEMFSGDGQYFVVHTQQVDANKVATNKVMVFSGTTGAKITERIVEMANIPVSPQPDNARVVESLMSQEVPDPVLVTSDKFLYVLAPNRTQVKVLDIATLTHVHTIDLPAKVTSININGFTVQ